MLSTNAIGYKISPTGHGNSSITWSQTGRQTSYPELNSTKNVLGDPLGCLSHLIIESKLDYLNTASQRQMVQR